MPRRPLLSRATRRLWRDAQTLQLGQPPGPALMLTGVDPTVRAALALVDGTRERGQLLADAVRAGCPPARVEHVLQLLGEGGLLEDATESWPGEQPRAERDRLRPDLRSLALLSGGSGLPTLQRRARSSVLVLGGGRVGAPLAGLLAGAGVGAVDVRDEELARAQDAGVGGARLEDVGRRRGTAARDAVRGHAPSALTSVARPDLVVLAPSHGDEDTVGLALGRDGIPHLLAQVRGRVGVVGPLVLPGTSACLHCLDLTRSDHDPAWPVLAAQLSQSSREVEPCDASLAMAVAAHAALQALALIDGSRPDTVGGTLELALPDWRWRRRSWALHPECDCRWQATG